MIHYSFPEAIKRSLLYFFFLHFLEKNHGIVILVKVIIQCESHINRSNIVCLDFDIFYLVNYAIHRKLMWP